MRPVGAELFHTDGRKDMTKLIVSFRDFGDVPGNGQKCRGRGSERETLGRRGGNVTN